MTITHKHSRRLTTRREEVRRQNPVSGTNETQSPSTHRRRPEKTQTQTKEGDRSPDQTRPPDPQRRSTDRPTRERTYLELSVDERARGSQPDSVPQQQQGTPARTTSAPYTTREVLPARTDGKRDSRRKRRADTPGPRSRGDRARRRANAFGRTRRREKKGNLHRRAATRGGMRGSKRSAIAVVGVMLSRGGNSREP